MYTLCFYLVPAFCFPHQPDAYLKYFFRYFQSSYTLRCYINKNIFSCLYQTSYITAWSNLGFCDFRLLITAVWMLRLLITAVWMKKRVASVTYYCRLNAYTFYFYLVPAFCSPHQPGAYPHVAIIFSPIFKVVIHPVFLTLLCYIKPAKNIFSCLY